MVSILNVVSPIEQMIAYEVLWAINGMTEMKLDKLFRLYNVLPYKLLELIKDQYDDKYIDSLVQSVTPFVYSIFENGFSICINSNFQFPDKLKDADHPLQLFYYKGDLGLLESKSIAVVGARECSQYGIEKAKLLTRGLVQHDFTIVSGLARGVDTVALKTAISNKGNVIGVIGTPINEYYPPENKELQDYIAKNHLLISQVPFYRYSKESFVTKRNYFPQRNKTMSAISEATVIIEASDKSGTITQARAAINQKRKLFILNANFNNPNIKWPQQYESQGAIRVLSLNDILINV